MRTDPKAGTRPWCFRRVPQPTLSTLRSAACTSREVSPEVSRRMRAVPRKNTAAELRLQASLRVIRLRYETHVAILGCFPDIVFRSARVAVFVDGDFWHGRLLVERGARILRQ